SRRTARGIAARTAMSQPSHSGPVNGGWLSVTYVKLRCAAVRPRAARVSTATRCQRLSRRARRGRSVATDATVTEGCPGRVRLANVIPQVDRGPADSVRLRLVDQLNIGSSRAAAGE